MKVNLSTKFVIYGASVRGKRILETLTAFGFEVIAFIDKKPECVQEQFNIAIYFPEDIPNLLVSFPDLVVIISISNVFTHMQLAESLAQKGVCYIIYKNLYSLNDYAKQVNTIYDELTSTRIHHHLNVAELPSYHDTLDRINIKSQKVESDVVQCQVPIELLFGLTKEFYMEYIKIKDDELINLCPDRNIMYFSINKELLQFFDRGACQKQWVRCLELYLRQRRCMIGVKEIDEQEELQHVRDRYNIFQNMEVLFNSNISFFYDNPSDVTWNRKGYFNIQDGNNRAAFLMSKGWNTIPCKMSIADYKSWINEDIISELDTVLTIKKQLEYAIPHPYYSKRIYQSVPFAVSKLKKVCEWMYENCIETHGMKVLDVACRNGYWGQCFTRMGAVVTAVETDVEYFQICQVVNRLVHNYTEKIYSDFDLLSNERYDIAFVPYWAYEKIKQVSKMVRKYIVVDAISQKEIEKIQTENSEFKVHFLCSLIRNGVIVYTIILIRL